MILASVKSSQMTRRVSTVLQFLLQHLANDILKTCQP
jgi:hypothetical protein